MNIKSSVDASGGSFYAESGSTRTGKINFHIEKGQVVIDHTEVAEKQEGKGIAKALVKAVVEYARDNDLKVVAHCAYARAVILRNDEFKDVT